MPLPRRFAIPRAIGGEMRLTRSAPFPPRDPMPTKQIRTTIVTEIAFTYDGAEPDDGSPAGLALAFLIAQGEQDRERCLACLTDASRALVPPNEAPPATYFGDVTIDIVGTHIVGESATVDFTMVGDWSGGQPLPSSMACQLERGQWRVDLAATMARMMSAIGQSMGQIVGAAQQGLGQLDSQLSSMLANLTPPSGDEPGVPR